MCDLSVLSREADDGKIENIYNLKIMNATEVAKRYSLLVEGVEGAELMARSQVRETAK